MGEPFQKCDAVPVLLEKQYKLLYCNEKNISIEKCECVCARVCVLVAN